MSEAAVMLRELSLPWAPGERMKSVIDRAARMARLTYWRTSDIWYGKARRVEAFELDQIKEALRIKNEKALRNELQTVRTALLRIESTLSRDAEFYRPDADFAREMLRQMGGKGRSLDR